MPYGAPVLCNSPPKGVYCAPCTSCTKFVHDRTNAASEVLVLGTMSLVMHLYELLACFALISSALVCVVLHPFLQVRGIYQEFGFGLAPFGLGMWTGTSS